MHFRWPVAPMLLANLSGGRFIEVHCGAGGCELCFFDYLVHLSLVCGSFCCGYVLCLAETFFHDRLLPRHPLYRRSPLTMVTMLVMDLRVVWSLEYSASEYALITSCLALLAGIKIPSSPLDRRYSVSSCDSFQCLCLREGGTGECNVEAGAVRNISDLAYRLFIYNGNVAAYFLVLIG